MLLLDIVTLEVSNLLGSRFPVEDCMEAKK